MGKLVIHTGLFDNVPNGVEVLGNLTFTNKQMFELGKSLSLPKEGNREVFTNNSQVIEGIVHNIFRGRMDSGNVLILYHQSGGFTHRLWIKNDGNFNYFPAGLLE